MENSFSTPDTLADNLIKEHGVKGALSILSHMSGYESTPPTIEEYLDSDEYLGGILGKHIYPFWRSALYEIYPNPLYSPYLEIIVTGAIGQGKSVFSLAGVSYDLCKLLHVKSPHTKYGILKSDKIVLALINATLNLAGGVLYDQLAMWFNESPFFRAQLSKSSGRTIFPKQIDIAAGSRPSHFLGKAIFSCILSEINFQTKTYDQAAENYNGVRQRLRSRFQTGNNSGYPGRMWIDSSKTDSGSFIEDYLLKDRNPEDMRDTRIFDNPRWKVLPASKLKLSGDTFKVFIGDQYKDPFIIERSNQVIGIDDSRILDVPIEYASDFRLDLYKSLQDIAGISTQATHRFITSSERIEKSQDHENPIKCEVVSTDAYNRDERLIDFIDFTKIPDDSRPRFIHIDLGLVNDKTGISSTRLDGVIQTKRFDSSLGREVVINEPVYYTDFVMSIESKSGQEVPIYKIKNLMIDLRARGYPVMVVSTDGYQSTNLRQDLSYEGFEVEYISVDRTIDPYIELKNTLLTGRWHGPKHPILDKELRALEFTGSKIDHPYNGSKDLADSVAGSIYSAKNNMNKYMANSKPSDIIQALESLNRPSNIYEQLLGRKV